MSKRDITNRGSRDILMALLDTSTLDASPWSFSDLRAILEHQLAASLESEAERLAESNHRPPDEVLSILRGSKHSTFGALLSDVSPCFDALDLIKGYVKASLASNGDLPREVARVLYVMTILRGRQAGFRAISTLDDASLERETRRCLTFGWLPDRVREVLRSSLPEFRK